MTDNNPRLTPERCHQELGRISALCPVIINDWIHRQTHADSFTLPHPKVMREAFSGLGAQMVRHWGRVAESQAKLWGELNQIWQRNVLGTSELPETARSAFDDRRFQGEGWGENPAFDVLRQSYLAAAHQVREATRDITADLDNHERDKIRFYTERTIEALAPTNSAATNPDVLRETLRTGGENLVRGSRHLLEDMARGHGQPRIRQTDIGNFELGRDIAATPGKVVYQNALMQLIQYSPSTEQVARRPLLIIPPWINKYYILDLTTKKSFIQWAVNQGLTVFLVSWVNPDASYAEVTFEDYMRRGPVAAMDAVEQATGERELNAIGYCIGGTLLASTLAWLRARGDDRVQSATFFTSLLDFTDVGPLSVFIDEEQIELMEDEMSQRGYLDGSHLANAFNLLQARDLIWGFVVNNYLMGREPNAFDLLYWNSDSTRMPYRMQSFYLRNMYLHNRLREPGGITLAGEPIDLSKIDIPAFFLATQRDHIAPWPSCYRSALLPGGERHFVLGGSGHIAGVINPEGSPKYGYWTNDERPDDPEQWFANASAHEGSWWPEWRDWIQRFSGGEVAARQPGDGKLDVIEDAPGSYVRVRVDRPDDGS